MDHVQLDVWSSEEISRYAVVNCSVSGTFSNGIAPENSLNDLKMGPTFPGQTCKTCGCSLTECPGHFGCIELGKPVYNIFFLDMIYKTLKKV